MEDIFDEKEFYELMQQYRMASTANQSLVIEHFEAVKTFIRKEMKKESDRLEIALVVEYKRITEELDKTRDCLFKAQDRNILFKKLLKKLL